MKKLVLGSLALILALLAGATLALAAEPAPAPTQPAPALKAPALCSPAVADATPAPADLFVPKPLQMDPPICNPFCINGQCSKSSECTAFPNGRCVLACPQTGCCVYD